MRVSGLKRYPTDVARAFGQAPLEVAYAALLAAAFSWAIELEQGGAFREWWELFLVLLLAGGTAWTGTLLHALGRWSARHRWTLSIAGGVGAAVIGAFFLHMEREAEVWRAAALVAVVLLLALAAPALGWPRDEARLRFRRVNGRLVLRCIGAALYAGALFAGLALALAAVDSLFELEMEGDIYGHVFGWIGFAVAPWIVVGGIPEIVRPLEERSDTMALASRVTAWLVLPLLGLYYVILYAYAVRILTLEELPHNLVSPLVMAAGILAAVALTLFDRGPRGEPGDRALRAVPALFLPLAVLGTYAVWLRVDQYGWTEFRYLRVAALVGLALVALGAVVQVARRRPLSLHLAPSVVAGVLVLSVLGPWSAQALSRRSQTARLVSGLEEAGLLRDGRAVVDTAGAPREISAERYDEIASTSRYLVRHFGRDAVSPPVPEGVLREEPEVRDLPSVLGVSRAMPEGMEVARGGSLQTGRSVDLDGVHLRRISLRRGGRGGPFSGGAVFGDSLTVIVGTGPDALRADLGPLVRWLRAQARPSLEGDGIPPERAAVPLLDAGGRRRGRLVVLEIHLGGPGDAPPPVVALQGVAVMEGSAEGAPR